MHFICVNYRRKEYEANLYSHESIHLCIAIKEVRRRPDMNKGDQMWHWPS